MIQRSAMRSYDTIGSPSLLTWQPPPNPVHSVLIGTGPKTGVPVFENTAKSVLTISTTWFGPTAPLLSGGAEFTTNVPAGPVKPCPMPSKLLVVAGATSAAAASLDRARLHDRIGIERQHARRGDAADRLRFEVAEAPRPGRHLAQRRRNVVVRVANDLGASALRKRGCGQGQK